MKKFTFKGVLDGFRQSVQPQAIRQELEIPELLRPEHFALKRTFRHGFPYSPTAFAFDPVQKLMAIGDKSGNLRIIGRPGVDAYAKHDGESECAVIHLEFMVNDGLLVTVTADDTVHLWDIHQKSPQVIQSLKFQRERVTCLHVPVGSKWFYVGTEKGNVHVVNADTFALSGYVINWNKAMEVTRTSHPGAVIALCDSPIDANKLLIAFECGLLVLWDLRGKSAEIRWQASEPVRSISWHYEGKYFISSHTDGSICSWPIRPMPKPQSLIYPHAKPTKEGSMEKCKSIHKVELKANQTGETYTIFSGGMPSDKGPKSNCITIMLGKTTTVLEMEHNVVDFITICENPWACETQEPYAIAVLLQYDLVLIDLLTPGFPCFESPYPMDLHESPVTCCTYLTDCPSDLVPAFYSVGRNTTNKKNCFSEREWPISGGEWSPASCSYSEIIVTGHQDGSVKFWDSGAGTLQILYKLKTAKIFEKPKNPISENNGDGPLAIQLIYLCSQSRRLCVAGSMGQVLLFKFRKSETNSEILVLEIPILYENFDDVYGTSPECDLVPKCDSNEFEKSDCQLKIKSGPQRKIAGFQCQLVCLTTGPNRGVVQITSLCLNSNYGLLAYGTEHGVVVIDVIQKACLLSVACPDLYGASDPYSRTPKSPKRLETKEEQSRSPSSDQLNDTTTSESPSIEFIPESNEALSSSNQCEKELSQPTSPENEISVIKSSTVNSPAKDETPIVNKEPQDRRKSMSWKTFNLKRQLSKVNMKIGLNINTENESIKNSAVFYTQIESPSDDCDLPLKETDNTCSKAVDVTESSGNEADDKESKKTFDVHSSIEEKDQSLTSKQVEFLENQHDDNVSSMRPNNLPLSGNSPNKLKRQVFKDKRDQRLLSVPNIKYQTKDLRGRFNKLDTSPSLCGTSSKKPQKLDGSFSRSRSSSISSIDMSSSESVTYLGFIESPIKKNDGLTLVPTLWIGTNFGSVLTLFITLPEKEVRKAHPVLIAINGGPVVRLKGTINSMSFLDASGSIIPNSFEQWRDERELKKERTPTKSAGKTSPTCTPTTTGSSPNVPGGSTSSSSGISGCANLEPTIERQYLVIASEKQIKVFDIIGQCCINRIQFSETDFVVKAETIAMKEGSCIATYLSNGHLMVHSLPGLKQLLDSDFLPLLELSFQTKCKQGIVDPMLSIWGQQIIVHEDTTQISKIFCFSHKGHGLYLASPTEIQKFTTSAEFCQFIMDMKGELFTPQVMPEQPKEGFFKGLFGGGSKALDREELFGEQSGKANRSTAKHIPGANLDQLGQRASTAASEISRAHQLAMERGEKLNLLEERAERMANQAQDFSGTAQQLMLKYKDKKWYQL